MLPLVQLERSDTKFTKINLSRLASSVVLFISLVAIAVDPLNTRLAIAQSAGGGGNANLPADGLPTARFLHSEIFGVAPAVDADCEYRLDRAVQLRGMYRGTTADNQEFTFEVRASGLADVSVSPQFVLPPGANRIEMGKVLAILSGWNRDFAVMGLTTRTVLTDGTEYNRIVFYQVLGWDLLSEMQFDPIGWAMGQFGGHLNALAEDEYEARPPVPEEVDFTACAEACRIKYAEIADRLQRERSAGAGGANCVCQCSVCSGNGACCSRCLS